MAKLETRYKKILKKFLKAKLNKKFYFYPKEILNDLKTKNISNIQKYKIKLKCKRCGQISYRKIENLKEKTSCDNCKKRWTFDQFLQKANKLNQTQKFNYLFDKKWWNENYKNRETRIKIQCKKCKKVYEQSVDKHLQGYGCKYCTNNQKMTYDQFLQKIKNNYLSYDLLINEQWWNENYINEQTKIPVKCKKCKKEFLLTASQIKNNKNCIYCESKTLTYDKFLILASNKHKNKYIYPFDEQWWNENYKSAFYTKIPIICPKHRVFYQRVMNHIFEGNGCPSCSGSNNEEIIKNYLEYLDIKFIYQYKIKFKEKEYIFDFYIPELNTLIEVDGEQHFKPVDFAGKGQEWAREQFRRTKKSDFMKNKIAFIENYKLIRIPYWKLIDYMI